MSEDEQTDSDELRELFTLCETNPDYGLELIRKMMKENPDLESYPFARLCIVRAYQIKGVKPLQERPWVRVGSAKSDELRLYINDENLDNIEMALSEVKKLQELDPETIRIWGEGQVDAMACILERCRPGRVQQILCRTKLNYFGIDGVKIVPDEDVLPSAKLKPFLDISFTFPSIVKSALVMELGRDEKGREFIHCMLLGKPFDEFEPEETMGDANIGTMKFFDDGTYTVVWEKGSPRETTCPSCGNPLTYIQQYQRFYCYKCKKYA